MMNGDRQHPVDCMCPVCRKRYPDPPLDDGERRDQQQAAEIVARDTLELVDRVTMRRDIAAALAAAREEATKAEAARWQAKIEALAGDIERASLAGTPWVARHVAGHLRALLEVVA